MTSLDAVPTTHLLVADDEQELLWTLSQRLARLPYTVVTAPDGLAAFELLAHTRVDVLVADIRMPRMNGLELVMAARRARPDLPVVVMTAYPTGEVLDDGWRSSIEYLQKPFDFSQFIAAVERALARRPRGFTGAISVQTLPDVVQLYALSNAVGALRITCGAESGSIWFDGGAIPHAVAGALKGVDAFLHVLTWNGGSFAMTAGERPPERTITRGWMELVLESLRIADERTAGEGDAMALSRDEPIVSEVPKLAEYPHETSTAVEREGETMGNFKESVGKLDMIDGFIGGCLCDGESGMTMASVGGNAALNLEVAAAANSEVLRAKRKAAKALNLKDDIEDILITLGKQYHLIRPLKSKPMIFFYLALDRGHANLAMARMTLADVEREVVF